MKLLLSILTIIFIQPAFSEDNEVMVCEIRAPKNIVDIQKEIDQQNCLKGDLLLIRDMKMTARYKRVAAHICDFSKKITNFDDYTFICYYQGFVRQSRNPNYQW